MTVFVFFAVVLTVLGLIHLYLWKRLVRDPLRPGPARWIGGGVITLLAVLVPVTLVLTTGGRSQLLGWVGYLWLAVMFYLLVTLLVLEVPRLLIGLRMRRRAAADGRRADEPVTAAASVPVPSQDTGTHDAPAHDVPAHDTSARGPEGQAPEGRARQGRETSAATGPAPAAASPNGDAGTGPAGPGPERAGVDRRLLLARGAAIFAGLTAASVTGYGVRTALGPPQLDRVQIPLAKLPRALDGTRFAVVSDIHLGPLSASHHVGRIVDMINSLDADVVCIVGDLVDGSVAELGRYAEPLARIRSRQGAYFVTGNHEYYRPDYQDWVAEVARLGVRPLQNERVALGALDLAGVNDVAGKAYGQGPDFGKALGGRDTSRPVVLLAHQPSQVREAAEFGVDLQLSGHTHGGQMVPFNLIVGLNQPVVSGYGKIDGVPLYVTNGAGFWGPPVRVGAPPQVTLVELRTP
ncbi:metallophosphoesterase [Krasilnikovia sp. MM14-A1259]|uniref:metallophosphoesterase n=1 Tax=Krasilnikovia sp. MM14-A1259 TaxID=3373539 RepID=UPI0037F1E1F4